MSGGQQQRVALARALAIEPRVLLLDEPLSALDAKVRVQLRDEIRRIQLELGVTTVFVTHDQEEALSMADRVGRHAGRAARAVRRARRALRPAGDTVRRRVRRHDEPARGRHGGRRQGLGRQPDPPGRRPIRRSGARRDRPRAPGGGRGEGGPAPATPWSYTQPSGARRHRLVLRRSDDSTVLADVPSHRAAELAPGTRTATSLLERPVLLATARHDRGPTEHCPDR